MMTSIPRSFVNPMPPILLSDLTDLLEDMENLAMTFHAGMLAEDLDSDRKEYVASHTDLLRTLDPCIVGITYRKAGRSEFAILRYENHVTPINIARMNDEEVTNALMDYAWAGN